MSVHDFASTHQCIYTRTNEHVYTQTILYIFTPYFNAIQCT